MFYIGHFAYFFYFVALAIRDILYLRIVLISAQGIFIYYGWISNNQPMLIWNMIFIIINTVQITKLIMERRPIHIPEEIEDLYHKVFNIMERKEFLYFWEKGKTVEAVQEILIREGEVQNRIMLILNGSCQIIHNNQEIANLSRGYFVAEMSYLTGEPASATVNVNDKMEYIYWNDTFIDSLAKKKPALFNKVQRILSRDIITKIKLPLLKIQSSS